MEASGAVLAVSGGPDSMALMHLAAAWRPVTLPLWVATVDHGLRPGARSEAEAVVVAAGAKGLPAKLLTWTGPKPRQGLQARARQARYDLLLGFARDTGASHLVTAHTLDDQAETLLMRLAAGSGPRGLAGMRSLSRRDTCILARPLLGLRKAVLVSLCRERGWSFVEDPANEDARFARTRWRRLGPTLAAEGLTPERLGQLGQRLARAEAALQRTAEAAAAASGIEVEDGTRCFAAGSFLNQPEEIILRVLDLALQAVAPAQAPRLAAQENLLRALIEAHRDGARLCRSLQGCTVTLDGKVLTIEPEPRRRRGRPRPA